MLSFGEGSGQWLAFGIFLWAYSIEIVGLNDIDRKSAITRK